MRSSASEWPCFKAKCAATRHLAPYLVKLTTKYNDNAPHDQRRQAVCQCLNRVFEIFAEGDRFLTTSQKDELRQLSVFMMGCYKNSADEAFGRKLRKWKTKPKLHETQHILEHQTFISPTAVWLYGDEDVQRHVKKLLLVAIQVSCHILHCSNGFVLLLGSSMSELAVVRQ